MNLFLQIRELNAVCVGNATYVIHSIQRIYEIRMGGAEKGNSFGIDFGKRNGIRNSRRIRMRMSQELNHGVIFDFYNTKTLGVFGLKKNSHIARRVSCRTGVQKSSANEENE